MGGVKKRWFLGNESGFGLVKMRIEVFSESKSLIVMKEVNEKSQRNLIATYFWKPLLFLCGDENGKLNRSVFWSFVTTIITLSFVLFASIQIRQVNRNTKGDILQKFSENFFKPETRELILLFEYDLIKFKRNKIGIDTVLGVPQDFGCFVKLNNYPPNLNIFLDDSTKSIYSSYEIDDYVLGHLEDLGMYLKMEMVEIEEIYLNYGWYIILFWENPEMRNYIKWCRDYYPNSASAYYVYSEYLYREIKEFEKTHSPSYYMKMMKN